MQDLLLKPILKEAWQKVEGSKWTFFLTFLAFGVIQLILLAFHSAIDAYFPEASHSVWMPLASAVIFGFLCSPLVAGMNMLGVRRAREQKIHVKQGFAYFKKILPLFITEIMILAVSWIIMFFVSFFVIVPSFFLTHFFQHWPTSLLHSLLLGLVYLVVIVIAILAFLALNVLFYFALILVADRGLSPIQACLSSIKMGIPYLKQLILAQLVFMIFDLIAAIPLGIGLLWSLPFSYIAIGIFYREISSRQSK